MDKLVPVLESEGEKMYKHEERRIRWRSRRRSSLFEAEGEAAGGAEREAGEAEREAEGEEEVEGTRTIKEAGRRTEEQGKK